MKDEDASKRKREDEPKWPSKTRELHNHHFDSTVWNDFKFRDDDVIISSYNKAGTTWLQQIVSQLIFDGDENLEVAHMSPWVDLRVPPKQVKLPALEEQKHRRFLKTHLPVDALVFSPKAKYILIARDARDVIWSLHNHHTNANDKWYGAMNETPGRVGPPIEKPKEDVREYFLEWLEKDGFPFWSFWEHMRSWWALRDLPNVKVLHFSELKADMPGKIRDIAQFLDIKINDEKWDDILLHCSFDYMKKNSTKAIPAGGIFWDTGSEVFINKGVNGRWQGVLTEEDNAKYEAMAVAELGADCAEWLKTGKLPPQ